MKPKRPVRDPSGWSANRVWPTGSKCSRPAVRSWARAQGFAAEKQKLLLIPTASGDAIAGAALGLGADARPERTHFVDLGRACRIGCLPGVTASRALSAWSAPRSSRWAGNTARIDSRVIENPRPKFRRWWRPRVPISNTCGWRAKRSREARDLINTPANDLGPAELGEAVQRLALQHEAECRIIVGEDLLRQNYPLIYEVGKGSAREPRLIDMRWGKQGHRWSRWWARASASTPAASTSNPSSGMILMKKDMGGAALVLALARMLMGADAPVQLRLLIPAVENSVSGRSFRPSDVLRSRQGLTVEIGNTDAEGRLVLADALAEADREQPALLIDLATLTGAARVALGPELPAIYSTPPDLAEQLRQVGEREADPMWPMPLWPGYDEDLGEPRGRP